MNCFFHDDKPAIITCAKCGVGLCKECMTHAAYTVDGKPVCLNCSRPIALGELQDAQSARTWSLVKFLFSGFFIGVGLAAMAGGADLMSVWIISGVAGIPTAFKATRRSREQRIMDDIHDRYENDVINLMFGWATRLIIRLAFIIGLAPVCALYTFISNLFKFIKSKGKIREAEEMLEYIDQSLNGGQDAGIGQEPQMDAPISYLPVQPEPVESSDVPAQPVAPSQPVTPAQANATNFQPMQTHHMPPAAASYEMPKSSAKKNSGMVIGIVIGVLVLVGLIAGYFVWYVPYAKDRDALRTYVVADNLFFRSSKVAGVEYNVLSQLHYGAELITYAQDMEWAEVKADDTEGFVSSSYLLEWDDFKLLNDVWGSADAKAYIESTKCRLALVDYCKRNQLLTGNEAWQLHTLQKDVKPNNVLFPRLDNGYDKFTEFAFILKHNLTKERRLAIYSFDEETEAPIFLYEEEAPEDGQIRQIRLSGNRFIVSYSR